MGDFVVRPYTQADKEGFNRIRSVVYRGGQEIASDDRLLLEDCEAYVVESEGQIVGASTVLDMTARRDLKELRCGGLAAVGVAPEVRRSGAGGALMREMLRQMRSTGYAVASLYAFHESYYRQFGYEVCGARHQIKCPSGQLPNPETHLKVSELPFEQRDAIYPVYERFSARYNGMNRRTPDQWWRVLGGDTPMSLYVAGDPIEAYIIVRLAPGFWIEQEIKELVWTSRAGYEAMLGLFRGMAMNKSHLVWREPPSSPYMNAYFNDAEVQLVKPIMFRLVNVPDCLRAVWSIEPLQVTLEVIDDDIPENRGPWRICSGQMGSRVEPGTDADVVLHVRHLAQALFGQPAMEELISQELVEVRKPESLAALNRLFPHRWVYSLDQF